MMTDSERAYVAAAVVGDQDEAGHLANLIDDEQAQREHRLAQPGALLSAALWYASVGVPVFPCEPLGKRPATAHGFKDASTDPDRICGWWRVNGNYNIGAPTGDTFDVIDVDGPAGTTALGKIKDGGGMPDVIAWSRTPHGFHYLIHPTGEGNRAGMLPAVDYRGAGGYIVMPPSGTPDGSYRWIPGHELRSEAIGV